MASHYLTIRSPRPRNLYRRALRFVGALLSVAASALLRASQR